MEDGVRLHLLACLWHNTGVQQDWKDVTIKLIVDLNPLHSGVQCLIQLRVSILNFELSECQIQQFFEVAVHKRDPEARQTKLCFEVDIGVDILNLEALIEACLRGDASASLLSV